jgi:hypothetical protein
VETALSLASGLNAPMTIFIPLLFLPKMACAAKWRAQAILPDAIKFGGDVGLRVKQQ